MRKTNRLAICALAVAVSCVLAGCANSSASSSNTEGSTDPSASQTAVETVQIKQSPDKYTWYVKNYIGMNTANVGYTAVDANRYDRYGAGTIRIVFVAENGTYIDPENEDQLKEYVVIDQNLEPNTEIKYAFRCDSDGKEYDSLVLSKSHEEIVLAVKKIGSTDGAVDMTPIDASPDKYTRIVRDYVGRNLAECGYLSMAGYLADSYGSGSVKLNVIANDGSYIDMSDSDTYKETISQYKVVSQNVAPNSTITMTFRLDSNGKEYDSLVSTKSLEVIDLYVAKIN